MSSFRFLSIALSLAALPAAAYAQAPPPMQPAAPIVHQYAPNQRPAPPPPTTLTSPAAGIWVRSAPGAEVKTVSSTADSVELSVTKGLANITLRHPKENEQILIDLPGGQVALVKDGAYTFNATTNTFRVLQGEAAAYQGTDANAKPLTVKEDHAVVFGSGNLRATEFAPFQARADILPAGPTGYGREPGYNGPGYYSREYAYAPYGYWGPYGDGFYAAPYYAWGYPYGAYGWGYPYGFGFGIGYGFGFGGFRGGLGIRR